MPLIRIEALVSEPPDIAALLHEAGQAAASTLDVPFAECRVRFHEIRSGRYLDRGAVRNSTEARDVSPLVEVVLPKGFSDDTLQELVRTLSEAIARRLRVRASQVFIELRVPPWLPDSISLDPGLST